MVNDERLIEAMARAQSTYLVSVEPDACDYDRLQGSEKALARGLAKAALAPVRTQWEQRIRAEITRLKKTPGVFKTGPSDGFNDGWVASQRIYALEWVLTEEPRS